MTSPSLPTGFRDMGPDIFAARKQIITTLEKIFVCHGFVPLETPAVEHLSTLLGKYGTEGDQLIFKILNSGDFLSAVDLTTDRKDAHSIARKICKRALRYDLTLPTAGYVARHRHTLQFPFKRYQIDRVWRADRPQKGRYREFYQCDIDVIGSSSLFHEATLLIIAHEAFQALHIEGIRLHLNDRRILERLNTQMQGEKDAIFFCQTLDKIDRIGQQAAFDILEKHGYPRQQLKKLATLLIPCDNPSEKLDTLRSYYEAHNLPKTALDDLAKILQYVHAYSESAYQAIRIDLQLARGMDYYTGAVFEMKLPGSPLGSFGGGGRYDNLMEVFGQSRLPSTGISFGLERIQDHLTTHGQAPQRGYTHVLIAPMEPAMEHDSIQYLRQLHSRKITAELYPAGKRMKHVLTYADKKNIPWVVIIGSEERDTGEVTVKNMTTGLQKKCTFVELLALLKGPPA